MEQTFEKVSDTEFKVTTPVEPKVEVLSLDRLNFELQNKEREINTLTNVVLPKLQADKEEIETKIKEASKLGVKTQEEVEKSVDTDITPNVNVV